MRDEGLTRFASCPLWCAGHDDAQEPVPPRRHRSEPVLLPVVERRPPLGEEARQPSLVGNTMVVALEQDESRTYVWIGPAEELRRSIALTAESAMRLASALSAVLATVTAR
jgi:hypothetical protein